MSLLIGTGTPQILPDPTTSAGVAVTFIDGDDVDTVFTSTGATPFSVAGVLLSSVTVPGGGVRSFLSDGTHWVMDVGPGGAPGSGTKGFRGTAVSAASGDAVFNLTAAGFAAAPVAVPGIASAASGNPIDYRITALTATSCTVNVRQSPTLVVLSLSVLGVSAPLAGVTVHLMAFAAGSQA